MRRKERWTQISRTDISIPRTINFLIADPGYASHFVALFSFIFANLVFLPLSLFLCKFAAAMVRSLALSQLEAELISFLLRFPASPPDPNSNTLRTFNLSRGLFMVRIFHLHISRKRSSLSLLPNDVIPTFTQFQIVTNGPTESGQTKSFGEEKLKLSPKICAETLEWLNRFAHTKQ